MPQTLADSPAQIVRQLLIDLELGTDPDDDDDWPVYATGEPDRPDNAVTVFDTTGMGHGRTMPDSELQGNNGFQVRIRSSVESVGWTRADLIQTTLAEACYQRTVHVGDNTYLVQCAVGIGNVLVLGKETPASKRSLFTVNALAVVRQIT